MMQTQMYQAGESKGRRRVALVDDDKGEIATTKDELEDAGFEVVVFTEPFPSLTELIGRVKNGTDVAIVDHRLGWHSAASFDGATAVAELVKSGFPALLITMFAESDGRSSIRLQRQWVPRVVRRSDASMETLRDAIEHTMTEVLGREPPPDRRPERVLLRIKEINAHELLVVIPGWDPREAVAVPRGLVQPKELLRELKADDYLVAKVNIGAHSADDLFFGEFEAAPEEAELD
jgi:CheY-like chemotaxis protein